MSIISTIPNYGGRQPNNTAYVKQFVSGCNSIASWIYDKTHPTQKTIKPIDPSVNVLIPNDLIVNGVIHTPSDMYIKEGIQYLDDETIDQIMDLNPVAFKYKLDAERTHYGFIAQELEKVFPLLVNEIPVKEGECIKSINYIELIFYLLFYQ